MPNFDVTRVHEDQDLSPLVEALSSKQVVMLGEATHGTSEFYTLRARITERLVKEHGFNVVAVEGDWPDAARLSDYIRTGAGGSATKVLEGIHRWPTWMWANREVAEFAERMQGINLEFCGLDVYSLFESISEVIVQLGRVDPELAQQVAARYDCFEKFNRDEKAYARSLFAKPAGCEEAVIRNLKQLLELRIEKETGHAEAIFDAQQNARVVRNAEAYYRSMIHGEEDSWNHRDRHMLETLDEVMRFHGPGAKAVIWAHNTHVGDYRATDMVTHDLVNLGGIAREKWGEHKVVLVGFGTYTGSVMAAHAWGARPEVLRVPRARTGSLEAHLHRIADEMNTNTLYFWTNQLPDALHTAIGHRAIGVVYDPDHEKGNYVPTILRDRYDAFVFVDVSRAVTPLLAFPEKGVIPETWPSGQ